MGFSLRVNHVIKKADIVIEVLDARLPEFTRNERMENRVRREGKKLLIAVNKSDLVSARAAKRAKEQLSKVAPTVFVSAKTKKGFRMLYALIEIARDKKPAKIAVVGYPNTGKSSVINLLSRSGSAPTSASAGFTRGEQLIKLKEDVYLVDTPGVIPYDQNDLFSLVLIGAKNANQVGDAEDAALRLVAWLHGNGKERIEGISTTDADAFLEALAKKRGKLRKGGIPDTHAAATLLINAWQRGEIRA